MVFPFGALAPDGRESGHQWHSRGQRFDPAYLHHRRCAEYSFNIELASWTKQVYFFVSGVKPLTSCILINPPPAAGRRLRRTGQRFDPAYLHHRWCAEYSFNIELASLVKQVFLLCGSEPRTSCIFNHSRQKSRMRKRSGFYLLPIHSSPFTHSAHSGFWQIKSNREK